MTKKTKKNVYVCGRCGYRSHHRMKCPSCQFMLEEECVKCYSAKGNCICRLHGVYVSGHKVSRTKAATRTKVAAAVRKKKKRKS